MNPVLHSIETQDKSLISLLCQWVNINSGSENLKGLENMTQALSKAFSTLNGSIEILSLPSFEKIDAKGISNQIAGYQALSIKKHPQAPIKIFFAGHMDTVYPLHSPFQKAEKLGDDLLRGPGVLDMKGGLLIMLKALEFLENSPHAGKIGWEVLINPDEEIGSPVSHQLFTEKAPHFHAGLIFEPSFPDGSIVNERKGSINYTLIAHGKAAHAGRDFFAGRNAIMAMARLTQEIENLTDRQKGITVNIGHFEGGHSTNVVPDLAVCRINIRFQHSKDESLTRIAIQKAIEKNQSEGISFELHEETLRPPKPYNKNNRQLFEALKKSAVELNIDLKWQPSGGVCDGNLLSAAGLPTIDTLGAVGGNMHTHDEYIHISSLVERIKLTANFLMQIAEGKIVLDLFRNC